MIATVFALALAAADPCAPVPSPAASDPATATLYREAGDAEVERGSSGTAAIAYARAAALDGGDAASRAALMRLCADQAAGPDAFQEGRQRMDAGDLRGAAASFERARLSGDRSAALLEGVCRYRLGDDVEAEAALRDAEQAEAHRDVARFYLGLLALRGGQSARAAELFDSARSNPSLTTMAGTLARMAHRDGRLVLSLSLQSGVDSNVSLAPKGATSSTGGGTPGGGALGMMNGDGLYDVSAAVLWRPEGPVGPYLRAGGALHRYFEEGAYDLATIEAGAGWQLSKQGRGLLGDVAYRNQRFGSAPYLQAGRATASGWANTGDVTWSVTWSGALQRYAAAFDAFSGPLHRLELKAAWVLGPRSWVALAYGGAWDDARTGIASYLDHGPRLELRAVLSPRWRAGLDAALTWRRYQAFDTALGARQASAFLDGSAFVEYDLANNWTARLSLDGRNATSNVAASEYAKLVPMAGLVYVFGM